MHRDEKMVAALLAHGAEPNAPLRTWTPTRRSSRDFNFAPELVGATPFWLAARFNATRTDATARALFFGSITYLPLLWIAMVIDKA